MVKLFCKKLHNNYKSDLKYALNIRLRYNGLSIQKLQEIRENQLKEKIEKIPFVWLERPYVKGKSTESYNIDDIKMRKFTVREEEEEKYGNDGCFNCKKKFSKIYKNLDKFNKQIIEDGIKILKGSNGTNKKLYEYRGSLKRVRCPACLLYCKT